jgi:hypothetical protein
LGRIFGADSAPPQSSSAPRGIRNNNPLNLETSSFTQHQPGFTGSDGRFGQFYVKAFETAELAERLERLERMTAQ